MGTQASLPFGQLSPWMQARVCCELSPDLLGPRGGLERVHGESALRPHVLPGTLIVRDQAHIPYSPPIPLCSMRHCAP